MSIQLAGMGLGRKFQQKSCRRWGHIVQMVASPLVNGTVHILLVRIITHKIPSSALTSKNVISARRQWPQYGLWESVHVDGSKTCRSLHHLWSMGMFIPCLVRGITHKIPMRASSKLPVVSSWGPQGGVSMSEFMFCVRKNSFWLLVKINVDDFVRLV